MAPSLSGTCQHHHLRWNGELRSMVRYDNPARPLGACPSLRESAAASQAQLSPCGALAPPMTLRSSQRPHSLALRAKAWALAGPILFHVLSLPLVPHFPPPLRLIAEASLSSCTTFHSSPRSQSLLHATITYTSTASLLSLRLHANPRRHYSIMASGQNVRAASKQAGQFR